MIDKVKIWDTLDVSGIVAGGWKDNSPNLKTTTCTGMYTIKAHKSLKNPSRGYTLTVSLNNGTGGWELCLLDLKTKLLTLKGAFKEMDAQYIVSYERGKYGASPHLQCYFELPEQGRVLNYLWLLFEGLYCTLHLQAARSSRNSNIAYVAGVRKDYEQPDNIIACTLAIPWELQVMIDDKINQSRLITEWMLYPWQRALLAEYLHETNQHNRDVIWITDPKGWAGKTEFSRYLRYNYGAMIIGGKAADLKFAIKNHFDTANRYPTLIILDVSRADRSLVSYSGLEDVKDGMFFSTKYESGSLTTSYTPHVIVMANFSPDRDKLSADRWREYVISKENELKANY